MIFDALRLAAGVAPAVQGSGTRGGARLHLRGQAVFGLAVGAVAKLLGPGHDPGGIIVTMIIGLVGSLLGTFIARTVRRNSNYSAHWLMSILGAVLILVVYRIFVH